MRLGFYQSRLNILACLHSSPLTPQGHDAFFYALGMSTYNIAKTISSPVVGYAAAMKKPTLCYVVLRSVLI
jgi:hypothetical protein